MYNGEDHRLKFEARRLKEPHFWQPSWWPRWFLKSATTCSCSYGF